MSRFASPEHQALSRLVPLAQQRRMARLLCLFDAFDKEEGPKCIKMQVMETLWRPGSILCNAFDELEKVDRGSRGAWLQRPTLSISKECLPNV